MLLSLRTGEAETAAAIGIGISPGEAHYPHPYSYISPWPAPPADALPSIPRPEHWHPLGFVGAVATGEAVLSVAEPRARIHDFIEAAVTVYRGLMSPG